MQYGLSQRQVAWILNTSRGRIANLEHNRTNPSPAYLAKLELLKRSVEAFSQNLIQIIEQ
jgi:transcriptional regulator with XRE-family HTH domain